MEQNCECGENFKNVEQIVKVWSKLCNEIVEQIIQVLSAFV